MLTHAISHNSTKLYFIPKYRNSSISENMREIDREIENFKEGERVREKKRNFTFTRINNCANY
jgi:hypothetical protein